MNKPIQFKKQRELGDILNDTFKFLREEYKGLFKALVRNALIPFIILLAISAYYATLALDLTTFGKGIANAGQGFLPLLGMILALLFYYGVLYGTILHYIKQYIDRDGKVNQDVLSDHVRNDLGRVTGLSFLSALILAFGFMLCFLPGIYVTIPLALTWGLLIFQNKSVGDSISDAFRLIKGEWWITFATFFVLSLLIYVVQTVFSIPAIFYSVGKAFTSGEQISQGDVSGLVDWVSISLNVLSSIVQYILAGILPIGIAFVYFNLNEKNNQTGTFETIDSIGSDL